MTEFLPFSAGIIILAYLTYAFLKLAGALPKKFGDWGTIEDLKYPEYREQIREIYAKKYNNR